MDPTALSYSERPPQVKWTSDMRFFLCCLMKYFEKNNKSFEVIFNARFENELKECGFNAARRVKWTTLNIQWEDMRRRGNHIWGDVHLSAFDPQPWYQVIGSIRQTAEDLGLQLKPKSMDSIDTSPARFTYRSPEPAPHTPSVDLNCQVQTQTNAEETPSTCQSFSESPITPRHESPKSTEPATESYEESPLCTAGGKVCLFCHLEMLEKGSADGIQPDEMPPLLYRWWNVESQGVNSKAMFVAGLFSDFSNYYTPDTITEDEFCRLYTSHISKVTTPSPFISTFKSLLSPVHRSLRAKEGASISIIDTKKLKFKAYSAKEFVKEHNLRITRTYNGAGEYLVWGKINSDAIICTFKITALRGMALENPDIGRLLQLDLIAARERNRVSLHKAMIRNATVALDMNAGLTMGKLLSSLEVPIEYCRTISEGFAYSWRINRGRGMPWNGFFEGVDLGYRGQTVMPSSAPSSLLPEVLPALNVGLEFSDGSDSEYTMPTDDDENEEDGASVFNAEDNDMSSGESEQYGTPTPVSRNHIRMVNPFRAHNGPFQTPPATSEAEPAIDDELSSADAGERREEVMLAREGLGHDTFASDRARVQSALGNIVFNSSG